MTTREKRRKWFQSIFDQVVLSSGDSPRETRMAIADHKPLPAELSAIIDKIRAGAADVTDSDITQLKSAGYTDDQIFELTVTTALSESSKRLDTTLRLLGRKGS